MLAPLAARGPEAFREAVSGRAAGDLVAAKRGALPQLAALAVVDAGGKVLMSTGGRPGVPVDVSDRDYFLALRDHPEARPLYRRTGDERRDQDLVDRGRPRTACAARTTLLSG